MVRLPMTAMNVLQARNASAARKVISLISAKVVIRIVFVVIVAVVMNNACSLGCGG